MKASLLILLLFIQISAFSQSFWSKVIDDQNINKSSFTANTLFQDSLILVGGFVGTASCPGSELFAYNLEGKRVWEKSGYFDVIYSDSNLIYTAGHIWGDDVLGFEQVVLAKFDKNGKEIFQTRYPDVPHYYYFDFVPNSMDINKNGTIVVSSKNGIIRVDSLGKVISETPMKFQDDISSIQFIGNDSLLINTNSTLYKIDTTFTQLDSISFKERNVSALIQNDTIYCLFANKLVILDINLNILDTILTSTDIEFKKIKSFDGDLWIQGVQGDQAKILQLHNSSISNTFTFDLLIQYPDFLVSPGNVIFTGTSSSNQIALYSYNKKAEPDTGNLPDIKIVDFEIGQIEIVYIKRPGEPDFPWFYNFTTEMIIKNNGIDSITSLAIYSYLSGGFNCAHNYFYQKFTDILILPNQEITIELNRITEDALNNSKEGFKKNKLCFECLAPNSKVETNLDQNILCKTFEITGLNGLTESHQYHIYPNPTNDFLKLEFEENGIKHIRLTNLNGSLLLETNITGSEANLDLTGFDPGIYLLSITSETGRFTQKIVKNLLF